MKLYYSKSSPFARKVQITAAVLGIQKKLELVSTDVYSPPAQYRKINPLVKVPAFETDSGEMLINSPFICQYLAQTTPGGQKIFPQGPDLWPALNIQAIADGGTDAAVNRRWETHVRSPDKFDSKIDQRHLEKVKNSLEFFESNLYQLSSADLTIKEISVICFVDYINFRFAHEKLENQYPRIFAWTKKWNENSLVKESSPL